MGIIRGPATRNCLLALGKHLVICGPMTVLDVYTYERISNESLPMIVELVHEVVLSHWE